MGPFRAASIAGLLVLMFLLFCGPALAFTDVPEDHPYGQAIADLTAQGIIQGYPDGSFGPNDPVLRQQVAKLLTLGFGLTTTEADICSFTDVDVSGPDALYPDNYIAALAARGITRGTDDTGRLYRPFGNVTRAQLVTMVVRAARDIFPGVVGDPTPYFGTLGGFSPEHSAAMSAAEYNLILDGIVDFGPCWNPWAPASRAEVAQVIWRFRTLAVPDDLPGTPADIRGDYADNSRLDRPYTRAELAALLAEQPQSGDAHLRRVIRARLEHHARIRRMIFDGDSLTAGSASPIAHPTITMATWPLAVTWQNIAVGGRSLRTMLALAPTGVDPFYQQGRWRNVVVIWGGTNDIALWNHESPGIYQELRQYAEGRRARGFIVVTMTTLPRSDPIAIPQFEARRQELNQLIRQGWEEFADVMVDLAADPRIGPAGAELNLTYYTADRVHLNAQGQAVVSELAGASLRQLDTWEGSVRPE